MSNSSFDPVHVTGEIALNVPLLLTMTGLLIAAAASVAVMIVRKLRHRSHSAAK
ncbi:hypothetical protein J2Y69_002015 [Microbacterium resistens]|uniref:Uncharacterized protein n=1 Tax=Microbacterium resistens TaxID=156977 RepID=A0ABU1SEU6_9MICO|nr:hypothetical protein [Microbacterium resistens]MDR6867412.1 hypothetical protein [Microbacterium resistens]